MRIAERHDVGEEILKLDDTSRSIFHFALDIRRAIPQSSLTDLTRVAATKNRPDKIALTGFTTWHAYDRSRNAALRASVVACVPVGSSTRAKREDGEGEPRVWTMRIENGRPRPRKRRKIRIVGSNGLKLSEEFPPHPPPHTLSTRFPNRSEILFLFLSLFLSRSRGVSNYAFREEPDGPRWDFPIVIYTRRRVTVLADDRFMKFDDLSRNFLITPDRCRIIAFLPPAVLQNSGPGRRIF